ncbi:MAG: hypothetical protein J6P16_00640, partial [Eubacterium sp.]|nr:hypothetical protein [Eubacterium sp.]
ELEKFREIIKEAENSELAGAADDEAAVSEMVSEVTDVDIEEVPVTSDIDTLMDTMYQGAENSADAIELVDQMTGTTIISLLKDTSFGTKTMYDFFMDEGLQKSDLYTLAYVLSDGQKSIIDDLGIYAVFESALTQYSEEQGESGKSDIDISGMEEGLISVYEGVDRSVFDGDTAITADTLKNMETRQVEDVLTPNDNGSVVLLTCAAIVGAVCTGLAIWGFGSRVVTLKEVSSVVKTMQANLNLMKTCDEAWKLNILETKYKISRFTKSKATLSSIVEAGGDTTTLVKNAYKEAAETMRSYGTAEKSVMDTIDAYGERQKATHIESYKRSINELKTSGKYYTTNKVKVPRVSWGARVLLVLGAAAAFAFAGYEIYCMTKKHTVEFTHIPANMVYKTTEGDVYYMTYHAVTDASGNVTDIHDKKGNGWQVIYTTTDSNAGDPILASSLTVSDRDISSDPDVRYLIDFDSSSPSDLADKKYTGKGTKSAFISYMTGTEEPEEADASEETEVSTEETEETAAPTAVETAAPAEDNAPEESSVFAWPGMLWILLIILVVAGGAAGAGMYYRKRKK